MSKDRKNDTNGVVWIILIGMVAVGLWAGSGAFIRGVYPNLQESAQFGDMFGAINALFSGLALGGVVVAVFLQRRDLELTRQEMRGQTEQFEAQRKEMAAQVEFMYQQSLTMIRQRSQDGFFQLLRNMNDIVANLDFNGNHGKAAFRKAMDLHGAFTDTRRDKGHDRPSHLAIGDLFDLYGDGLNQYLGFLEVLLVYVESQDEDDRPLYVETVKANMTVHEVRLLQLILNQEIPVYPELKHLFSKYGLHQPAAARSLLRNPKGMELVDLMGLITQPLDEDDPEE